MECPVQTRENEGLLLAYCAGRLDRETAAALEQHMEGCASCRMFRDRQQAVWSALDAWETLPVSPVFDRELYARIDQAERGGFWGRLKVSRMRPAFRPALPLAAASVLLLAAFLVQSPPSVSPPAHSETEEAEQVERTLDDLEMLRQLPVVPHADAGVPQAL